MQPQNQTPAPTILDPDTLAQVMGQMSGNNQTDPNQSTQNILQLYKQAQQTRGVGQYGPAPQGMSQSEWNNMCEKFAEAATGNHQTGKFPTAASALNYYAQNGQLNTDLSKAPANALIYYQPGPANGYDGHVALNLGNGMTRGATSTNGIQNIPVNGWGAQPVGWVIPK